MRFSPTFYDKQNLQKITNLPVFGTVSLVVAPTQVAKNRISVALFISGMFVLLLIYAGLVATQAMHINLPKLLQ